ncbi:hypothetical protein KDX31_16765 [Amphritea atlantica]|uniref:Uncharacterized protein n=1 Tax=Amphritea atlantica TaxID=355243 RepID=A0ABY5GV33_9GAMM|nr:hypothetical protein KDX31_16765 [Amphritea atlantica]
MASTGKTIDVGAQDPELKTSPITGEMDEDFDLLSQVSDDHAACLFNNATYPHGCYVTSGTVMFVCNNGIWLNVGSSDTDNL